MADTPVFVILGVQGSGTNLLSRVLVRGFDFSLIEDGSVIFHAAAKLGDSPAPADIRRAYNVVRSRLFPSPLARKTKRLVKAKANFEGIDSHFEAAQIESGAGLARFVYDYGAYQLGTSRIAIKSDDLWEHIDRIDHVLPKRRIILLTRDFRDNLLSIASKDFGPIDPLSAARYVKRQFAFYEAEYLRTPVAYRCHVRYEDILDSPHAVARRLSDHFGLPLVSGWHTALDAICIRPGTRNKWESLGTRRLGQLEAFLSTELRRYGYRAACGETEIPGRAEWIIATASDTVRRIGQKSLRVVSRLRR